MQEIWKPINLTEYNLPNFEVSNLGNIRHVKRKKIRKVRTNRWGYQQIHIHVGFKSQKCISVHKIVASTFLDKKQKGFQVNHKNGIKTDNRVDNLEWVTPSNNIKHSIKIGRSKIRKGEECKYNKNSQPVQYYARTCF